MLRVTLLVQAGDPGSREARFRADDICSPLRVWKTLALDFAASSSSDAEAEPSAPPHIKV